MLLVFDPHERPSDFFNGIDPLQTLAVRHTVQYMSAETLPRIFFDTNVGSHAGGYWLILDQSKKDLDALGERLRDGEEVLIWMPNELEMAARLRFEKADDAYEPRWVADPVEGTVKHFY